MKYSFEYNQNNSNRLNSSADIEMSILKNIMLSSSLILEIAKMLGIKYCSIT